MNVLKLLVAARVVPVLRGPLPLVAFMPTGDVNVSALASWAAAGAVALGLGSSLVAGYLGDVRLHAWILRERLAELPRQL